MKSKSKDQSGPICSVIIPSHNSSSTLERCLDSVIGQGISDLEIIVVDDGSTDGSPEFIEIKYGLVPYIQLVRQHQQGPAAARNRGLVMASGKYIYFLDSDDWLERDSLDSLIETAEAMVVDAVRGQFRYAFQGGAFRGAKQNLQQGLYTTHDQIFEIKTGIATGKVQGFSWLWLFRRDAVQNFKFPTNLRFMEDVVFIARCLDSLKSIFIDNRILVNYWQSKTSLTGSLTRVAKNIRNSVDVINELHGTYSKPPDSNYWSDVVSHRIDAIGWMVILASREHKFGRTEFASICEVIWAEKELARLVKLSKPIKRMRIGAGVLWLIIYGRNELTWRVVRFLGATWKGYSFVKSAIFWRRTSQANVKS